MSSDVWIGIGIYYAVVHLVGGLYIAAAKKRPLAEGLAFATFLGPLGLVLEALLPDGGGVPEGLVGFFNPAALSPRAPASIEKPAAVKKP